MAQKIDGRALARSLDSETQAGVAERVARNLGAPGLAVVLVGCDPASEVYVAHKIKACARVGIESFEHRLPESTSQDALLTLIARLNIDPTVHGILVQVPLPKHIHAGTILGAIDPGKDVDGFHPVNVGRLSTGTGGLVPCTPLGVMKMLDTVIDDMTGMNAVVIGKSNIVGKPIAMLLLEREATVTVTHIETRGLPEIARQADIIVVAAGSPGLVRGFWVKEGAVLIDVGITRLPRAAEDGRSGDRLVGDIAFDEVQHAHAVTPVPGGVGPMTIACLLSNTLKAARNADDNSREARLAMGYDAAY